MTIGEEVAESLREQGVAAVALGFVDPSAIVRVKCVPLARFPHAVTSGVGATAVELVSIYPPDLRLAPT